MKYIIGDWVEYRNTYARVFESFEFYELAYTEAIIYLDKAIKELEEA